MVTKRKIDIDNPSPLTDENGEVRELAAEDFARGRPAMEVIPDIVEAVERLRGQRGPQKSETKDRVGLRLDHNVVEYFRSTGPGWQRRINDILADHVKKQS